MFTGIIESVGRLKQRTTQGQDARLVVRALWTVGDLPGVAMGDSVAVNGVCLTVVGFALAENHVDLSFDVSHETLDKSSLGALNEAGVVNLERALRVGDRMGGHWVTGHVDAVGQRVEVLDRGQSWDISYRMPEVLEPELVAKGSICIDGVSLTVNRVWDQHFSVTIIPHTVKHTQLLEGQGIKTVNLETDIVGKYLRRFVDLGLQNADKGSLTLDKLMDSGFAGGD